MGLRKELEKRIEKKWDEVEAWEKEIARIQGLVNGARSYIQALEDTLGMIPKEDNSGGIQQPTLRPGTAIFKARETILSAGRPVHIDELLKAIGKPADPENRGALSGSLSSYVRKGQVFTRPAPNTFGLVSTTSDELPPTEPPRNAPPKDFGKDLAVETDAGSVEVDLDWDAIGSRQT